MAGRRPAATMPAMTTLFRGGVLILPDRLLPGGEVEVRAGRIAAVRPAPSRQGGDVVDLGGRYLAPGYVDLHVHGGDGADFMDGTEEAFRTACRAHARHGTTSLLPTTTAARHGQHLAFLDVCRRLAGGGRQPPDGATGQGAEAPRPP